MANFPVPSADGDKSNHTWVPNWARELKSIPGALSAVGKLITGTTKASTSWIDIGTAQNEEDARAVRDRTEAKSAITKAAVKVMVKELSKNPETAERLLERILSDGEVSQSSRENIGIKALTYIRNDPPSSPPDGEPTDEWLRRFGAYAEQATSETLRSHWAHILSHEIKSPGKFSLAALHLASLLDKDLAEVVERVAKTVVRADGVKYGFVPLIENYYTVPPKYDDLMILDGSGFLTLSGSAEQVMYNGDGKLSLLVCNEVIESQWAPNTQLVVGCATLTRAGSQLIDALEFDADKDFIAVLKTALQGQHIVNFDKTPAMYTANDTQKPGEEFN